jgi:hypothetical protein
MNPDHIAAIILIVGSLSALLFGCLWAALPRSDDEFVTKQEEQ